MHRSLRRTILACAGLSAVAALAVPAGAGAIGTKCSGSNVTGQGSSLQALAQHVVWGPKFNSSTNVAACNGTQGTKGKPEATYTSTGSGAGGDSWGRKVNGGGGFNFGPTNAFLGTDEPPSKTEKENEESHGTGTVLTIPVLQGAVAIVIHLPKGCTATSKVAKGRLNIDNVSLEEIFRGTLKEWGKIKGLGNELKGTGCTTDTIKPVVRQDGSGTTHIFKRYLGLISSGTFETEKAETKGWNEIASGSESTTWPKAAEVLKGASAGGPALLEKVEEEEGSIGYANLADARAAKAFVPPTGGVNKETFWAELQNNGTKATGQKYTDPALNKDVAALSSANCKETAYTDGANPFPPPSAKAPWNEVSTATTEKHYTLCGLTYDLALSNYVGFGGTEKEATTVSNFIEYAINTGTKGGQKEVSTKHDYLALPAGSETLERSVEGVKEIG